MTLSPKNGIEIHDFFPFLAYYYTFPLKNRKQHFICWLSPYLDGLNKNYALVLAFSAILLWCKWTMIKRSDLKWNSPSFSNVHNNTQVHFRFAYVRVTNWPYLTPRGMRFWTCSFHGGRQGTASKQDWTGYRAVLPLISNVESLWIWGNLIMRLFPSSFVTWC